MPDLKEAYETGTLTRPVTSFRHWAHGLADVAKPPTWHIDESSRQVDPQRDLVGTTRSVKVEVPAEALLTTVPEAFYAGIEDVLLTALALSVASWRGRSSVTIDLEGHGREEQVLPGAELSRTVGWFTTQYPVSFDLSTVDVVDARAGGGHAGSAVKLVKEALRAVPDKGVGYRIPARDPEILFNYLGRYGTSGSGPWTQSAEFAELAGIADDDAPCAAALEVTALADGDVLRATFSYPAALFTHDEVHALADAWRRALLALVDHTERHGGGHTPSDMPLVSIGQDDLDAFDAKWGAP